MTGYADALLLRLNRAVDVGFVLWYSPAKQSLRLRTRSQSCQASSTALTRGLRVDHRGCLHTYAQSCRHKLAYYALNIIMELFKGPLGLEAYAEYASSRTAAHPAHVVHCLVFSTVESMLKILLLKLLDKRIRCVCELSLATDVTTRSPPARNDCAQLVKACNMVVLKVCCAIWQLLLITWRSVRRFWRRRTVPPLTMFSFASSGYLVVYLAVVAFCFCRL